jgi:hypothetical protein
VCESGERRCVDNGLERCNDGRSAWEVVEACYTAALCELSLANGSAACESPRCAPEEHRCRAETLTVCNDDLTGFVQEQVCASAALCDTVSESCQTAACQSGARRCNGAQIETCNADRTGFERAGDVACASASLCIQNPNNDVTCRAPVCADGQFRCAAGGVLQRCSSTRDAFADLRVCDSSALCDATLGPLGCKPAACLSGERRCQGASLLACRAGRDGFDELEDCGALGCDAATLACRVRSQVCTPGEAECRRGDVLAVCNARGTGFDETECDDGCDEDRDPPRCDEGRRGRN